MTDEIARLRAEIDALKKDVSHLLRLLDQSPDESGKRPEFASLELAQLTIRSSDKHSPLVLSTLGEEGENAEIAFYDSQSRCRLALCVEDNTPRLDFHNAEGKLTAELAEADEGSGQFCVCDETGNPRAGMRVAQSSGLVNVLNGQAQPLAVLLGTETGGEIHAVNNQQRTGVKILASERGGVITVHEPSGQTMAFLSGENNFGLCTVYGPLGSPALTLAASDHGGTIVFFDEEGEPITTVP
jgi:hypothetical protein